MDNLRYLAAAENQGILILNVDAVEAAIWPDGNVPRYEDQWDGGMSEWLEANRVHYYAHPKEEFFVWEAIEEARIHGCVAVLLENMS